MPYPSEIVDSYLAAFNETDPDKRRTALAALYDEDSTYTDPHVDLRGYDQIDAFITGTQERFPGFVFSLAGDIDSHHEQLRFRWQAGPANDPHPPFLGFDVIVTGNGKIRSVYGFMDASPQT